MMFLSYKRFLASAALMTFGVGLSNADDPKVPVFKDGEAQIVPEFKDPADWVRHDLWVETEFDSDGDGKLDRMHVDVTRQKQTDTEGLKVAVIYESSPYYAGTGTNDPQFFWNPRHELNATPPMHVVPQPIPQQSLRPTISESQVSVWVPRGFAVVHSCSPGTGLSQGCPTVEFGKSIDAVYRLLSRIRSAVHHCIDVRISKGELT